MSLIKPSEVGLSRADATSATCEFQLLKLGLFTSQLLFPVVELKFVAYRQLVVVGCLLLFQRFISCCSRSTAIANSSRRGTSVASALSLEVRLLASTIAAPKAVPVPMPSSTNDEIGYGVEIESHECNEQKKRQGL